MMAQVCSLVHIPKGSRLVAFRANRRILLASAAPSWMETALVARACPDYGRSIAVPVTFSLSSIIFCWPFPLQMRKRGLVLPDILRELVP